mgnify:CR=1 FL=1
MKDHYDDINVIHYNDFGIAFNWKQNTFSTKNKIQFWIVCFMFIYSPFIKFFREEICNNFKKDFIMHKV